MRINEETVLVGSRVVLVPYRKGHVERYHEWMNDAEIRQQTASEPLTIEEEYEMQQTWHKDDDKLTFILLARAYGQAGMEDVAQHDVQHILDTASMAGDVNLFVSERHLDDDEEAHDSTSVPHVVYDAELEVMIAEPTQRRKGLAKEALAMLMYYASAQPTPGPGERGSQYGQTARYLPLPADSFVAKVGLDNAPSIAMFDGFGFKEVKRSAIFNEVELRPDPTKTLTMQPPLAILRWPRQERDDS